MSTYLSGEIRPSMDELCDQWLIVRQPGWTFAPCENWQPEATFLNPLTKIKIEEEKNKVENQVEKFLK